MIKTIKFVSQIIRQWRHKPEKEEKLKDSQSSNSPKKKIKNTGEESSLLFQFICKIHSPVMLIFTLTSLTGIVSYRFYNQPELGVGTISMDRIYAPKDATFEDFTTTDELRRNTRNGLSPILKHNDVVTDNVYLGMSKKLNKIEKIRSISGSFPYLSENILSVSSQKFLRECSDKDWQEILINIQDKTNLMSKSPEQKLNAFKEIKKYQTQVLKTKLDNLFGKINQVRQQYNLAKSEFITENITSINDKQQGILLNIDDQTWQLTKNTINNSLSRILTQGIHPGLPDNIKNQTVLIQLDSLPEEVKSIAVELVLSSLEANLEIDEVETKNRAEKAVQSVEPVMVSIKKDQVIVDKGDEITQSKFVLLDGFGLSRRGINWMQVGLTGLLVTSSTMIFLLIAKQSRHNLRRRDDILLWLLSLTVPVIVIFDASYNSLPVVGLLVSSFYGPTLALTNVTLITGLTLFGTGGAGWEYLIASYAGSVLASFIASRLHSREDLALLGGGVGLTQGVVYLIINLILSASAGTIWYAVLPSAIIYGFIGVAYSIIALGISPYLERIFDLITPIRLAELSNPNRPLLKKLAMEAPGTFQHTMFVASLAETAARELSCNVELVRAGTLYHDIGKMHDPLGFIENQMGGPNKHDKINDPVTSANIIKKHVTKGLVMARQYGLPKAIKDFIPQHQGTILISYFYFIAKNQAEEKGIEFNEDDFRYDGPIPQSRETGIVMLADGCEAALRSLKGATPEQALITVQKIFKARWRDHQLDECGIKYEELPIIAEIFVRVWQQFNHQRIVYPKGAL